MLPNQTKKIFVLPLKNDPNFWSKNQENDYSIEISMCVASKTIDFGLFLVAENWPHAEKNNKKVRFIIEYNCSIWA